MTNPINGIIHNYDQPSGNSNKILDKTFCHCHPSPVTTLQMFARHIRHENFNEAQELLTRVQNCAQGMSLSDDGFLFASHEKMLTLVIEGDKELYNQMLSLWTQALLTAVIAKP